MAHDDSEAAVAEAEPGPVLAAKVTDLGAALTEPRRRSDPSLSTERSYSAAFEHAVTS